VFNALFFIAVLARQASGVSGSFVAHDDAATALKNWLNGHFNTIMNRGYEVFAHCSHAIVLPKEVFEEYH